MAATRILVVDDYADIRNSIALVLAEEGHDVRTARDGTEGLRLLEAGPAYDLIVSDLRMPNLDGPSLYLEVGRRWPDCRPHLLFMSGFAEAPQYAEFLHQAKVPVLHKPFRLEDLVRMVDDILQRV
jgi:DNA-binding NtrC family response regulator